MSAMPGVRPLLRFSSALILTLRLTKPQLDTSANIAMTTVTFASRQEPEPELGLGTRPRELFESGRERERERGVSEEGGTAVDGDDERGELKVQGVNLNGRRLSGG
ncbi:hypothetical protein C8F01DRAFT_1167731 [Mycena amicta]|nr:hypothetical protein C8F01DRAFT_1167731 [Mycena amicta]